MDQNFGPKHPGKAGCLAVMVAAGLVSILLVSMCGDAPDPLIAELLAHPVGRQDEPLALVFPSRVVASDSDRDCESRGSSTLRSCTTSWVSLTGAAGEQYIFRVGGGYAGQSHFVPDNDEAASLIARATGDPPASSPMTHFADWDVWVERLTGLVRSRGYTLDAELRRREHMVEGWVTLTGPEGQEADGTSATISALFRPRDDPDRRPLARRWFFLGPIQFDFPRAERWTKVRARVVSDAMRLHAPSLDWSSTADRIERASQRLASGCANSAITCTATVASPVAAWPPIVLEVGGENVRIRVDAPP